MEPPRIVRGNILLPPHYESRDSPFVVVVRVEDVSRADAPSAIVAEHRREWVPVEGVRELPFAVEIPESAIDPRHTYSVFVHFSSRASPEIERGDLISTQSHPVLTRGAGTTAQVPVKVV
jgi:uncharacterized lipoprotein YbaY